MSTYAHTLEGRPPSDWEPLFTAFGTADPDAPTEACSGRDGAPCPHCEAMAPYHGHLNKVAWWSAKFAADMFPPGPDRDAARQWGYLAGLWHDLGKFAREWQTYLASKADPHQAEVTGKVDHSTAGARHAVFSIPVIGHMLAFAISGHHSGLLDALSEGACLEKRLRNTLPPLGDIPDDITSRNAPGLPPFLGANLTGASLAPFARLLFSCLVDADFLATESFMSPERAQVRPPQSDPEILSRMFDLVEAEIDGFGPPRTRVNRSRAHVYEQCLAAADLSPGLFSLPVPTGGGKTLSSLAFALKHAIANGQRRVIYVIPFTSIIEQNAAVFSRILDPLKATRPSPVVLEHHSNLSPEQETERSRLAAENWDAPLIVTTAVRFYESLHAARTSDCRKLHRIANSVVILDEAQCLPVDYLHPCLSILDQLARHYHTSVVLCTATQPAIHRREKFPIGLEGIRPIIPDPARLATELKRVRLIDRGHLSDEELAAELDAFPQALVIVNTRRHAQLLFQRLPTSPDNFHLSALMCPEHRRRVLETVRNRLDENLPARLISTQIIEAGVDIDFARVYRALAGLDSIAQAAGRCNRHGHLDLGETHVFRSEHQHAEAYLHETAQVADQVLALHDDPLSLEAVEHYFHLYYINHNPPEAPRWDTKDILSDFRLDRGSRDLPMHFQFKSASCKFRLIENKQTPILIPYDATARRLIENLRTPSIPLHRNLLRSLQRYTVQVHEPQFHAHAAQFESLRDDQFHVLICPETHYSDHFGLNLESDNTAPLICDL